MKSKKYVFLVALVCIGLLTFADSNEDLFNACKQGDFAAATAAIAAGADVNSTDASGNTPLGNAFFWPEITKVLLDKGADPNGGNYPALLSACAGYSTEVVKLLLDAGADPNKPGITEPGLDSYKSLIEAEKAKGKKKANKALIKAYEDAIANAKPTVVYPANAFLIGSNHVPALKMMLEKGMKVEFEDGTNALETFVSYCNSREMRQEAWAQSAAGYARFGYKVPDWVLNLPDDKNGTAVEMLELLLSTGVDFNKVNANGFTPLCETLKGTILAGENTKYAKINVAKMLIEKGADVNASSTMINSNWIYYPICLATEIGDMSLVKLLVEKGADINVTVRSSTITLFSAYASVGEEGGKNYTAMIIAIIKDDDDIANFLIANGADMTIGVEGFATMETDKEGLKCLIIAKNKSPIYWAIERGNGPLIEAIAEAIDKKKFNEFSVRPMVTIGGAEGYELGEKVTYHCPKFKKVPYSPSKWARLVGYDDAEDYLLEKGL